MNQIDKPSPQVNPLLALAAIVAVAAGAAYLRHRYGFGAPIKTARRQDQPRVKRVKCRVVKPTTKKKPRTDRSGTAPRYHEVVAEQSPQTGSPQPSPQS